MTNPSLVDIKKNTENYGAQYVLNISCNGALFLTTFISTTTLIKLSKQIDELLKDKEISK